MQMAMVDEDSLAETHASAYLGSQKTEELGAHLLREPIVR
jgi:hypothetical protein